MMTIALLAGIAWWIDLPSLAGKILAKNDIDRVMTAWHSKTSNIMVEVEGRVMVELPDQEDYGHVQQFILELETGHRLMVSHDLEISQRVPLTRYSSVRVKGEYDWNETGGLIHWTHRDLDNARDGGWIDYNGVRYR